MAGGKRLRKQEGTVTVTATNPVHVCLLLGRQAGASSLRACKTSLSCLAGHSDVHVTLIQFAGGHGGGHIKHYIETQLKNTVDVTTSEACTPLGGTHSTSELFSFVVFLPAGDWLSDRALDKIDQLVREQQPDIIYTDEDRVDSSGHLTDPLFKPDASPELFLHVDYVGSLLCISKSTLAAYGGIDLTRYQEERYRLLLQAFCDNRVIAHLAEPIYHARSDLRQQFDASAVLARHCRDQQPDVVVEQVDGNVYRLKRAIIGTPKVSIIIPFRDKPALLRQCLHALTARTDYSNFEVIGISNRSQSITIYELMQALAQHDQRFRFLECNIPFNFSALVNFGVSNATGDYIVLMNNDISVINSDWLHAMLEHGQRAEIGVVGAKLLYPNDTIQHAGISVQRSGYIAHMHKHFAADCKGYMNRLVCVQNVSAVTGALCLFRKSLHQQLNGFDEKRFKIAFNDVDFCLRAEARGYSNIFTPYALAYHHESLSRGYETSKRKKHRFGEEQKNFHTLYAHRMSHGDPYYNPNLNQDRHDFSY